MKTNELCTIWCLKHVLNSESACKNSVRKLLLSSFIYNSKDCIYRINFTSLFYVGVNFLSHPMGRMWYKLFCIMSLPCFFHGNMPNFSQ